MALNQVTDIVFEEFEKLSPDCAEVSTTHKKTTEIYFESGKISMIRTNFNNSVGVKIIRDGKKGIVASNDTSEENLRSIVNQAYINAETAKPDDANGVAEIPATESFEYGAGECDLEALYNRLSEFIEDTKKKYPKISFDSITAKHVVAETVYRNTNGVNLSEKSGCYIFSPMYMAVDGDKTSSFNSSGVFTDNLDIPFMKLGQTERLLGETENQINTISIDGKFVGDIIATPQCFDGILETVEGNFLSDGVLINGTSVYKDKLNEKVAADCFTLRSLPNSPELVNTYKITSDGYVAKDMPLFENGILKNFVISRYGAKRTGLERSVNEGGCYIVDAGNTSLEDMIKSVKKGILLNRFSGGSPGVNGDITGVAKNSFLIEDGKIVGAVSETMISGNLAKMLLDIKEISKERINDGSSILPWVKIGGITVSGK